MGRGESRLIGDRGGSEPCRALITRPADIYKSNTQPSGAEEDAPASLKDQQGSPDTDL